MKNAHLQSHLYVLLATFLVAGSFLASQKLSQVINPFSLTLLRFVGGALLLAPFVLSQKIHRQIFFKTLPKAMVISLFYSMYFVAMFKALSITTVLNTGTLYTLVPLLTAFLAFVILKEHTSMKRLMVYLIGLLGTLWVVFKGNVDLLLDLSLNSGDFIFILGCLSMCLYSIYIKKLYVDENIWLLVFATLIGGAIWMGLFMILFDYDFNWHLIQGNLVFNMAYLIIGTTIITLYLYQRTTVALGPTTVMSYIYLNPIAVALLLLLIEEQAIESVVIPGIIITSLATLMLQLNIKRNKCKKK